MICEYCKYRFSWDCEEGYISYPDCESFTLNWESLSDDKRDLIEAILKGMGDNCYEY